MTPTDKRYMALVVARAATATPPEEQRAARRHAFQTTVEVTPLDEPGAPLRLYLMRRCPTIDISQGCVRLLWVGAQRPGRVAVRFEGPRTLECAVAWSREVAVDRMELGLRFLGHHPCYELDGTANEAAIPVGGDAETA